jgi:hypothetical protein
VSKNKNGKRREEERQKILPPPETELRSLKAYAVTLLMYLSPEIRSRRNYY